MLGESEACYRTKSSSDSRRTLAELAAQYQNLACILTQFENFCVVT